MPRDARPSLFAPIAFAVCAVVFAAGAGYTWWLDHRAAPLSPLPDVRAATLPALETGAPAARPAPAARHERRARPAEKVVRKCRGADGVPIFTSTACPTGAQLVSETTVEVPTDARPAAPSTPAPQAVAIANATVVNAGGGYGIPSRHFRRDVERERAWNRCERAKLRADTELAALRLKRKMSDIRRWERYAEDQCAAYEMLSR